MNIDFYTNGYNKVPKFLTRKIIRMGVPEDYKIFEMSVVLPFLMCVSVFLFLIFLDDVNVVVGISFISSILGLLLTHLIGVVAYSNNPDFFELFILRVKPYCVQVFHLKAIFKQKGKMIP